MTAARDERAAIDVDRGPHGTSWSSVGAVGAVIGNAVVNALHVFDDGVCGGAALYPGGKFFEPFPSQGSQHIARWTGTQWVPLGFGLHGLTDTVTFPSALSFGVFDDGFGSRLYVGGQFRVAGTIGARKIASWGACTELGTTFCYGDGSLATPCPCNPLNTVPNPRGAPGAGCANSYHLDGARLRASGKTNPDTVQLLASDVPPTGVFGMFVVGDAVLSGGFAYGDGVRCVDGAFVRCGAQESVQGALYYPNGFQFLLLPLSAVSGVTPGSGVTRYDQAIYRNPVFNFCSAGVFNLTNAVEITWN